VIRYVVRPQSILTTPRLLRNALNARRTVVNRDPRRQFSYHSDFLLTLPPIEQIEEFNSAQPIYRRRNLRQQCPDAKKYGTTLAFYNASKHMQRQRLEQHGINVPEFFSTHADACLRLSTRAISDVFCDYVVRPLRHSQGIGYRLTRDPLDFEEGKEYISRLYPKAHEYRVIFVYGTPLITLLKRVPDDIDRDGPWNHAAGSSFVTVTDPTKNRLRHFDVVEKLRTFDVVQTAHLVGADIMLGPDKSGYAVTELNFCPSITIPSNLERIKQHVAQVLQEQGA